MPNPNQHPNSREGLAVSTRSGLPRVAAAPHRSHGRWPRCMSHVSFQTQLYASSRSATRWADIGTALACHNGFGQKSCVSLGFTRVHDVRGLQSATCRPTAIRDPGRRSACCRLCAHRPRWWFLRFAASPSAIKPTQQHNPVEFSVFISINPSSSVTVTAAVSRAALLGAQCHNMVNANSFTEHANGRQATPRSLSLSDTMISISKCGNPG